jgi:hypothetical protein
MGFCQRCVHLILEEYLDKLRGEVAERHEEKLLAPGPIFERLNDEYFAPLIDRVFAVMDRRGLIPTPPEEMDGQQ